MKHAILLSGILAVHAMAAEDTAGKAPLPNVLLIMADDFGYELLSAYGGESFKTPVLDGLAKDGTVFDYCFACPLCTPTRVSIMTGKYNHRNYRRFGEFPPQDETRTFGNLMKKAGYATCVAGKWQLGRASPAKMGFDVSMQCDCWSGFWVPGNIFINEKRQEPGEPAYRPDIVCDFLLHFIETNKDGPFFAYWPMFLTHHPEEPSPDHPDKELIEQCKKGVPVTRKDYVFPDMVTYMDKLIGRAVTKLDELGIRDNTIIMFVGDNGTCGGHPPVIVNGKEHPSGGKGSMKDLGTRVPLIVNWRGVTRGVRCNDLVDITDFFATLADVGSIDLTPADGIDGVSFLPQIRGQEGSPRDAAFVLFDRNDTVAWRAHLKKGTAPAKDKSQGTFWARTARWKLYGDGRLFDMEADQFEDKPLTSDTDTPERQSIRTELEQVFVRLKISQDVLITFDEYKKQVESGQFKRHLGSHQTSKKAGNPDFEATQPQQSPSP